MDHRLAAHRGTSQLEVSHHRRPAGQGPAFHQPGSDEGLRAVADHGDELLRAVERGHLLDEAAVGTGQGRSRRE